MWRRPHGDQPHVISVSFAASRSLIKRMPVQVLSGKLDGKDQEQIWLDACNASFAAMIKDKQSREAEEAKATVATLPSSHILITEGCSLRRETLLTCSHLA